MVAMSEPCQTIAITQQTCYIRFAEGKPDHSDQLPYLTARGEMLIADFDADGRVLGIELVGEGKPCQSP